MTGDEQKSFAGKGKVLAIPRVRRTSLTLTLIEFTHALVLMLWVGSLAGFALVVLPSLLVSLPDREMAVRATLEILDRAAFLGCGAGALLLLTTLLMHLFSMREPRAVLVQMGLLLVMTTSAVTSQVFLAPRIRDLLAGLTGPLTALPPAHPTLAALGRLQTTEMAGLVLQVLAGIGVVFFTVRRWYRYLPLRQERLLEQGSSFDPRSR